MKKISQVVPKVTRRQLQKDTLFLIFCSVFFVAVTGFLWHIKNSFDDDLKLLRNQKEAFHIKIEQATQDRKNYFLKRHLYEKAKQEGFAQSSLNPAQVKDLVTNLSKKNHLSETSFKRETLYQEESHSLQTYTIFLSAPLDVDVFNFIKALSQEIRGVVDITLLSLFREEDGVLKGEIRFNLTTSSSGEVSSS